MKNQRKRHYITDTETGVRPINVIKKLPVNELTDDEICKLFFIRFGAVAMVMSYVDKVGQEYSFGRLRSGESIFRFYRAMVHYNRSVMAFLKHQWRTLPMPEWDEETNTFKE